MLGKMLLWQGYFCFLSGNRWVSQVPLLCVLVSLGMLIQTYAELWNHMKIKGATKNFKQ